MNFTFSASELAPLIPVMIVAVTAILAMLLVALKRNHTLVATVSVIGLNIAALYIVAQLWLGVQPTGVMGLFTIDPFALVYMLMILVAALACCTLSHAYIDSYKDNKEELYILLLSSVAGAMLMVASNHYASFFISLELMSIPVYGMLAYTYQRGKSLEAGIKYLVLSATASAMLLMGFAYLYAYTGEMTFVNSALKIIHVLDEPLVAMGLGLVIFACAFKLSLAPFHKWTPDVYQGAPTPMVTFLATVAKVAMLGLFLRYVLTSGTLIPCDFVMINGVEQCVLIPLRAVIPQGLVTILTVIAVLSILLGNLLAVTQVNIKRILAYSSIAHFGYLLVALVSIGEASTRTITVYIAVYTLTTIGAFGAVSLMSSPYNNLDEAESLADYRGLFWRRPVLTATLTVMMLSLAGIPLTAGFIAKFMVVWSAVSAMHWFLAAMIIFGSGIGLYYYLRVMVVMYMTAPNVPRVDVQGNWGKTAGGIMVLGAALLVLFFGIYPEPLLNFAEMAQLAIVR